MGGKQRKKHPRGKLKGSELRRVHKLLDGADITLPGHCIYKHKVTKKPEPLTRIPVPLSCTRKESEAFFHYYNFKKFELYRSIMDGKSYTSISRRLNNLNDLRWGIVQTNMSLMFRFIKKHPNLGEFDSEMTMQIHHCVDAFNPKLGFAPSTFLTRGIINHAFRCYKGNANQQNMKYVYASEMGRYPGDDDFQEAFEAHTVDIESNEVLENIEFNEMKLRVRKLLQAIKDPRDRKIIEMRFFSTMTLTDIGIELGVSKERIRQLEGRALEQMRTTESRDQFRKIVENRQQSLQGRRHPVGSEARS